MVLVPVRPCDGDDDGSNAGRESPSSLLPFISVLSVGILTAVRCRFEYCPEIYCFLCLSCGRVLNQTDGGSAILTRRDDEEDEGDDGDEGDEEDRVEEDGEDDGEDEEYGYEGVEDGEEDGYGVEEKEGYYQEGSEDDEEDEWRKRSWSC